MTEQPASWASEVEQDHERACMEVTTAALEALRAWASARLLVTTRVTWSFSGGQPLLKVFWRREGRRRWQVIEVSGQLQSAIREARADIDNLLEHP